MGIALVVCLDVAFILMTAKEAQVQEMAQVVVPHISMPLMNERRSLEPVPISDSEEFADRDHVADARAERFAPRVRSRSAAPGSRRIDTSEVQDSSANTSPLFPDKIIYIRQNKTFEFSDPPELSAPSTREVAPGNHLLDSKGVNARSIPETKKKSFESRAFGVIKKPYHVIKKPYKWIKSLASKIAH